MKNTITICFAAILLVTAWVGVYAQNPISDVDVEFALIDAPRLDKGDNATKPVPTTGHSMNTKWLAINITYKTYLTGDKSGNFMWLDDMTIDAALILQCQTDTKKQYGLFTGTQMFWSIPLDGRKHRASLYIPPFILARHIKIDKNKNTFLKEIEGAVIFRDKDGKMLQAKFFPDLKGSDAKKVPEAVVKRLQLADKDPNIIKFDNSVFPREKTPWQWVDADTYDLPKGGEDIPKKTKSTEPAIPEGAN